MRNLNRLSILAVALCSLYALPCLRAEGDSSSATEFAQQLQSSDVEERRDAAYGLAALGKNALPAVDALVAALRDRDTQVRAQTIQAIAAIGADADSAVPALIEVLSDGSQQQRYRAAYALGKIGEPAIKPLLEEMADANVPKREAAVRALGFVGTAASEHAPQIIALLTDDAVAVQSQARETLWRLGAEAVPDLMQALENDSSSIRSGAAYALGNLGVNAASAADKLVTLAKADDDMNVRANALMAAARIAPDSITVIDAVLEGIRQTDPSIQLRSVEAILKLNEEARQRAIPDLIDLLPSNGPCSARAAFVLGRMRGSAADAIPQLIDQLAGSEADSAYARALISIGPAAVRPLIEAAEGDRVSHPTLADVLAQLGAQARQETAFRAGRWRLREKIAGHSIAKSHSARGRVDRSGRSSATA